MNELENIVKSVVYGGIGAAATIVEKGGELARALVEKGQETLRANQDTVEDLKRRAREFCDKFVNEDTIDVTALSREQRDELRRQLKELEETDKACDCEDDCDCGETCSCEDAAGEDDTPEVTYTAPDEP